MSEPMKSAANAVCPRCRATRIEVRSTSPEPGVWTVFGCATCLYAWRSTEPDENADPDKYPAAFRLKPEQLPGLPIAPAIPPLRGRSGSG